MNPVVVTGASGFLGRHIVHQLMAEKYETYAVARGELNFASPIQNIRVQRYEDLDPPPGATLIHLAETNSTSSQEDGAAAFTLLENLLAKPFERVLFASSATVYGDQNTNPSDTDEEIAPTNAYAQQKQLREQLVLDHGGTVIRIANVYGPGMSTKNVMSDILAQLDAPGPISVRDDTPIRDYVWVEDVAKGVLAVLNTGTTGIINIGTGFGVSVRSLAQMILSCAGQENRTIIATSPTSAVSNLVLDIRQTASKTGWKPQTALSLGIERLLHS